VAAATTASCCFLALCGVDMIAYGAGQRCSEIPPGAFPSAATSAGAFASAATSATGAATSGEPFPCAATTATATVCAEGGHGGRRAEVVGRVPSARCICCFVVANICADRGSCDDVFTSAHGDCGIGEGGGTVSVVLLRAWAAAVVALTLRRRVVVCVCLWFSVCVCVCLAFSRNYSCVCGCMIFLCFPLCGFVLAFGYLVRSLADVPVGRLSGPSPMSPPTATAKPRYVSISDEARP
jgi:hypothetical protein